MPICLTFEIEDKKNGTILIDSAVAPIGSSTAHESKTAQDILTFVNMYTKGRIRKPVKMPDPEEVAEIAKEIGMDNTATSPVMDISDKVTSGA